MDWEIACQFAFRTLSEAKMGEAGVYYGESRIQDDRSRFWFGDQNMLIIWLLD